MGIYFHAKVLVENNGGIEHVLPISELGNSWARREMFEPYIKLREDGCIPSWGKIEINREILDRMKYYVMRFRTKAKNLYYEMQSAEEEASRIEDYEHEFRKYSEFQTWSDTVLRTYEAWEDALANPHCTPIVTFS
jgi:hypothetical protein